MFADVSVSICQDLCRQHMAAKSSSTRQEAGVAAGAGANGGGAVGVAGTETSRVSSVSSQFSDAPQASPSSHSSTPSWCEEPAQSNMDISTGHMILVHILWNIFAFVFNKPIKSFVRMMGSTVFYLSEIRLCLVEYPTIGSGS